NHAQHYLDVIDQLNHNGPQLNAVIETSPTALTQAIAQDRNGTRSGLLHDIPILIKDNIATTGDGLTTCTGSFAMEGNIAPRDAFLSVVGLKPTVRLVSRTGVIPISARQDSPGYDTPPTTFLGVHILAPWAAPRRTWPVYSQTYNALTSFKNVRVAISKEAHDITKKQFLSQAHIDAFTQGVEKLKTLGADIVYATLASRRVQKLQEKNLVREEAAKKARAAEDAKAKAKRAKEAKAIAAVAAKAADEAAKEAAESASKAAIGGVTDTTSGDGECKESRTSREPT
ncbi:hypothetical protein DYB36_013228, partial [Aphanomyces astaci]